MNILFAAVTAIVFGSAIYMILSRHMVRILLGLSLLTNATNLILFQAGRLTSNAPPLIAEGEKHVGQSADPFPQALILTAIVIGFALTLVLAAFTLRAWRGERTLDTSRMRGAAELGNPDQPEPGKREE